MGAPSLTVFSPEDVEQVGTYGTLYGATVMLANDQWNGACAFTANYLPTANVTLTTAPATSNCVRFFNGTLPGTMYQQILQSLTFDTSSAVFDKLQLSFVYVLWTDPGISRLVYDHESGATFGRVATTSGTYADAASNCTNQPGGLWQLGYPSTNTKSALTRSLLTTCTWIDLTRATNNGQFQPSGSNRIATYAPWAVNTPMYNNTFCVKFCYSTNQWTDSDCEPVIPPAWMDVNITTLVKGFNVSCIGAVNYTTVLVNDTLNVTCTNGTSGAWAVNVTNTITVPTNLSVATWTVNETVCQHNALPTTQFQRVTHSRVSTNYAFQRSSDLFRADQLPPDAATIIFAARVNMNAGNCTQASDRFVMRTSSDNIVLTEENYATCTLRFTGEASLTEYNRLLAGLRWLAFESATRLGPLSFEYVYSAERDVHEIVRTRSGKVHYIVQGRTRLNATNLTHYPYQGYIDNCLSLNAKPSEIVDAGEFADHGRFLASREVGIGVWRAACPSCPWLYVTSATGAYLNSGVAPPATYTLNYCAVRRASDGLYEYRDCMFDVYTYISCEATGTVYQGEATVAAPPAKRGWDGFSPLRPFNASFGAGLYMPVYGMTVAVLPASCRAGDTLTATSPAGLAQAYTAARCELIVTGTTTAATSHDYGTALASIELTTTFIGTRGHMGFSYILWTDSAMTKAYFDAEARHSYVVLSVGSQSWDAARTSCQALYQGFDLPMISTPQEAVLVNLANDATGLPIGYRRSSNSTSFFWQDRQAWNTFIDWKAGTPTSSAFDCAAMGPTGDSQWIDVDCTASSFATVVCESPSYAHATTVTFEVLQLKYQPVKLTGLVSGLPTGTNIVYGATIMTRAYMCSPLDVFWHRGLRDAITVAYSDPCVIMFAGPNSLTNYQTPMSSLEWSTGDYRTRSSLTFSWIYWTASITRIITDGTNAYAVFGNAFTFTTATSTCANNSMVIAHAADTLEARDIALVLSADALAGAKRTTSSAPFLWTSTGLDVKLSMTFAPLGPRTPANLCSKFLNGGGILDVNCSAQLPVVCRSSASAWTSFTWGSSLTKSSLSNLALGVLTWRPLIFTGDNLMRTNPVALETDVGWMTGISQTVYGATVQIASNQCDGTFTLASTAVLSGGVTGTLDSSTCRYVFKGEATVYQYKQYITNVTVSSTNTVRSTVSVGYALWDQAYADMALDIETKQVFVTASIATADWYGADLACRALSKLNGFQLPEALHNGTNLLLRKLATTAGTDIPLRMVRNATAQYHDLWRNNGVSAALYRQWPTSKPDGTPGTDDCVMMSSSAAFGWEDVPCSTTYTNVVCQSTLYSMTAPVVWTRQWTNYSRVAAAVYSNPVGSVLSSSTGVTVYGATVNSQALTCNPGDRFAFTASNDQIVVVKDTDCMLMLAGRATRTQYNDVLTSLQFLVITAKRKSIRFGVIYWYDDRVRSLVLDLQTSKELWTTPNTEHAFDAHHPALPSAEQHCQYLGFDLPFVTSRSQALEVARVGGTRSYLGANRSVTTDNFTWAFTTTAMNYVDYAPFGPQNNKLCLAIAYYGQFIDIDCSTKYNDIVCQSPYVSPNGAAVTQSTFTYAQREETSDLLLNFDTTTGVMTAQLIPPIELAWIASSTIPDRVFYGATAQLAIKQCTPDDTMQPTSTFGFSAYDPTIAMAYNYAAATCSFSVIGADYLARYVTHLGLVQLSAANNNFYRHTLTVTYMFWTTPSTQMYMDEETLRVYAFFDTTSLNFQGAYDRCRTQGVGWKLVEPTDSRSMLLISRTGDGRDIPIGLVRDTDGRFGTWTTSLTSPFAKAYHQHWASNQPDLPAATGRCALAANTFGGYFDDRICNTMSVTRIMCQKDDYEFAYAHTFYLADTKFAVHSNMLYDDIFAAASFPASTSTIITGVTLQVRQADCMRYDRFTVDNSANKISLVNSQDCVLMLAGAAPQSSYAFIVNTVDYRGTNALRRKTIVFGYVIWQSAEFRNLVMYMTSAAAISKVYMVINTTVRHDPPASYPFYGAAEHCAALATSIPAEPDNLDEFNALRSVSYYHPLLLGATRPASTAGYSWDSRPMTLNKFVPRGPVVNTKLCLQLSTVGLFEEFNCGAEWSPYLACEKTGGIPTANYQRSFSKTFINTGDTTLVQTITYTGTVVNGILFPLANVRNSIAFSTQFNGVVWGATAQMDLAQCDSANDIIGTTTALASGLVGNYVPTHCAYQIAVTDYTTPVTLSIIMGTNGLGNLRFETANQKRQMITFGFVLWTSPTLTNMYMDLETKVVYTSLGAQVGTWETAWQTCNSLGDGWRLYANRNVKSAKMVTAIATGFNAYLDTWRYNTSTPFLTRDMDTETAVPMAFQDWDFENSHPSTDECATLTFNEKRWRTMPCGGAPTGGWVMCEKTSWDTMFGVAWIDNRVNKKDINRYALQPLFSAPGFGDVTTIIYGVTLMAKLDHCHTFDRWSIEGKGDADILLRNDSDCRVMLSGKAYRGQYISLMRVASYSNAYFHRDRITPIVTGYVMWTTRAMVDLIPDFTTGSTAYATMYSTVQYTPTGYTYNSAADICLGVGATIADITTANAQRGVHMTLQYGSAYLGATRSTDASPYLWGGSTPLTVTGIRAWMPSGTDHCLRHDQFNEWHEQNCSGWLRSVVCKFTVGNTNYFASYADTTGDKIRNQQHTYASTVFIFEYDPTTNLTKEIPPGNVPYYPLMSYGMTAPSTWGPQLPDFTGVREISRATYYVPSQMCRPGDFLVNTATWPAGMTYTWSNATCTLVVTGQKALSQYMYDTTSGIMGKLRFKSETTCDTTRTTIAVQSVLNTDSRITSNMWMDWENRHVYAVVPPVAPVTWEGAYLHCRQFGEGWRLASSLTETSLAWLRANVAGTTIPILNRRSPSGVTFDYVDTSKSAFSPTPLQYWADRLPYRRRRRGLCGHECRRRLAEQRLHGHDLHACYLRDRPMGLLVPDESPPEPPELRDEVELCQPCLHSRRAACVHRRDRLRLDGDASDVGVPPMGLLPAVPHARPHPRDRAGRVLHQLPRCADPVGLQLHADRLCRPLVHLLRRVA
jgi:hypothetical protein